MTQDQASRIIVGALVATALLGGVAKVIRNAVPGPRLIVGAFAAGVALTMFSEVAPGPAAGLAVVILLGTAVNVAGEETFTSLSKALAGGSSRKAAVGSSAGATVPTEPTPGATRGTRGRSLPI